MSALAGCLPLLLQPDGQLIALSDQGDLIRFGFEAGLFGEDGQLSAPLRVKIEPLDLLSAHQPAHHRRDAESLAWLDRGGDPRLYIGFERDHRVQRHLPDGRAETRLAKPTALQGTFGNTGLEALSQLPDSCLFAVTEGVRRQGGLRAYRYCGGAIWETRVYVPSSAHFVPTAADLSPNGEQVYLIERAFKGLRGFRARLVRLPVAAINAGEALRPEVVLDLSDHMPPTWNVEGLTLTQDSDGKLLALMLTDDGFRRFLPTAFSALELPD